MSAHRLLVFGGRAYPDREIVFGVLDRVAKKHVVEVVIHGDAGRTVEGGGVVGADRLAGAWAEARGVPVEVYPVSREDWRHLGPRAGPLRNQRMIVTGRPTLAIGFPGDRGTADMRRQALAAGISTWSVTESGLFTPS
jgi:hypothetical protein